MKNIVDEDGEIIAKATDDHTLIGGHHRLAVAASPCQIWSRNSPVRSAPPAAPMTWPLRTWGLADTCNSGATLGGLTLAGLP